jgi:hypothetical protein
LNVCLEIWGLAFYKGFCSFWAYFSHALFFFFLFFCSLVVLGFESGPPPPLARCSTTWTIPHRSGLPLELQVLWIWQVVLAFYWIESKSL